MLEVQKYGAHIEGMPEEATSSDPKRNEPAITATVELWTQKV